MSPHSTSPPHTAAAADGALRHSLHRVTPVTGATARHSAIFAYSRRPGVVGTVARTRQLFGRVAPAHRVAEARVRVDQLMD